LPAAKGGCVVLSRKDDKKRQTTPSSGGLLLVVDPGSRCQQTNGATRMKYMLLIYYDEQSLSETEREQCFGESTQLAHELNAKGQYLGANPLHPTLAATSVRVRNGKWLVTDGPFAETREQLGGYFLIDAKNLDEAIGIAARIPMVYKGTVEVRPVVEIPGLPV
jgi:hypothetical protein